MWARLRVAHVRLCLWCGLGALADAKESRGRIAFQMASILPLTLLISDPGRFCAQPDPADPNMVEGVVWKGFTTLSTASGQMP